MTSEKIKAYKREWARKRREDHAARARHAQINREYMRRASQKGLTKKWRKSFKEKNPLYCVWKNILMRTGVAPCANVDVVKNYKLRGITICDEWLDYKTFEAWALSNGWKIGLEIDRINNDGNYEPNNCRFVTHSQNNRNTRATIWLHFEGKRCRFVDLWEKYGKVSYSCARTRFVKLGWSIMDALTKPTGENRGNLS